MSIHIILGRPGSGKSMYAVHCLIKELVEGQRNIVTNLPLKPDILNEFTQTKYPDAHTRFVERLRIMSDDEMRNFWKFRGPPLADQPNGDDNGRGVAYFLDEAHIAFNARDWATLGRDAINYMSQHRKLGDIVWPITQACGNLDKQFRSVAEDYTVLRNEYTAKMGIFRGMGRFVRKSYYFEPQGKAEPFETATFSIDTKGVAACYDTAKGIGVHGSKADIGRRAKGIPIWWVFPGIILLASACVFIPMLMGRAASNFIAGGDSIKKAVAGVQGGPQQKPSLTVPTSVPQTVKVQPAPQENKLPKAAPKITGYLVKGREVIVTLEDGSVITDEDGRLTAIRRGRVKVDGEWVKPKGPPREAGKILQQINNLGLDRGGKSVIVESVTSTDGGTKQQTTKTNDNDKDKAP